MKVEERPVKLAELSDFAECGVCGTAAVVCPVGKVLDHGREICFPSGMESMGPVIHSLSQWEWEIICTVFFFIGFSLFPVRQFSGKKRRAVKTCQRGTFPGRSLLHPAG